MIQAMLVQLSWNYATTSDLVDLPEGVAMHEEVDTYIHDYVVNCT
jgi:hypothetical protein